MKSKQYMQRKFAGTTISQRTDDQFFNVTTLIDHYNNELAEKWGENQKQLTNFWNNSSTEDLGRYILSIAEVKCSDFEDRLASLPDNSVITPNAVAKHFGLIDTQRGRYGGTWMSEDILIRFTQWLSPYAYTECLKMLGKDVPSVIVPRMRKELIFGDMLQEALKDWRVTIVPQFPVLSFKVDFYLPEYNLAIEYDEAHHAYRVDDDKARQTAIEETLGCKFIRVKENSEFAGLVDVGAALEALSDEGYGVFPDEALFTFHVLENESIGDDIWKAVEPELG